MSLTQSRGLMEFEEAKITNLAIQPAENDPTSSLVLSARFTIDIADRMGVRDSIYREDGSAHTGWTKIELKDKKLRAVDVGLPGVNTIEGTLDQYRPQEIIGFRVTREDDESAAMRIHMRLRVKNREIDLAAFVQQMNKKTFAFKIRSLQEEFNFSGEPPKTEDPAANLRAGEVERSGALFRPKPSTEAVDVVEEDEPETVEAAEGEPILPAIHETGGGRNKRRGTRGEVASIEEAQRTRPRNEHPEMRGDIAGEHHPSDDKSLVN